jgi:hypothetical protein
MMKRVQRYPSSSQLRKFGYAMLGGFAVLGALFWWVFGATTGAVVCWALGPLLLLCSLWAPAGQPVYYVWMSAAAYMGTAVTCVLLTILFLVFLPVFSLIRLTDPLRYKWRSAGSYWEDHSPYEPSMERMMRPF